jgi:hypothetical protein
MISSDPGSWACAITNAFGEANGSEETRASARWTTLLPEASRISA